MRTHTNPLCTGCTQDIIRDCRETLGVNQERPCLIRTVRKLKRPSEAAGIPLGILISILHVGVPAGAVVALVRSRVTQTTADRVATGTYAARNSE
jgi:hypothetical protein